MGALRTWRYQRRIRKLGQATAEGFRRGFEQVQRPVLDIVRLADLLTPSAFIDIVFEAPPGPGNECVFVEVERDGRSIQFGEWITRPDGLAALRVQIPASPPNGTADGFPQVRVGKRDGVWAAAIRDEIGWVELGTGEPVDVDGWTPVGPVDAFRAPGERS